MSQDNLMKYVPVEVNKWGEMVQAMTRVKELEADLEKSDGVVWTLTIENARLQAEVERLSKPAIIGGYNLSQYIHMANSETLEFDNGDIFADMTLPERIKYIVESHARLKAEVEKLTFDPMSYLDDHGEWMPRYTHLVAVERLKAEIEGLKDEVGLMNQLFEKHMNPEIRKAMVKAVKKGRRS